ncbi:MAG: adenylate/guanylate cyclase protein [Roseomonas sp.]|nr:adenylate/guanylate cyclase protein [Roseomonas sp.]
MRQASRMLVSDQHLERRLAVLVFLDVAGYSMLMGLDEESTIRRWAAMRRETIEPRLRRWHGRVVDHAGDALFIEFRGVPGALHWAAEVQATLARQPAADPPMQVRIAIHLDNIVDGARGALYGDGVNIAARLQSYAEPGGIIVSKAVVDAAAGKATGDFLDLGELHLRNILRPVHAFGLRIAGVPATQRSALPLLGAAPKAEPRPSVAVLPFRKGSADPEEAFAADGIMEGIVHTLAGLDGLFVISRSSTMGYAGLAVDVRAVGQELGVRYVLQGSLRRAGGRLRIATELSEAETGAVVRADLHEGAMAELFDLQDRISAQVVTALAPSIRERELRRVMRKHPESLTAYDLVLQGLNELRQMDRASFARAHGLLLQAVAADPGYAPAYSNIAWWHVFRIAQGWSTDTDADRAEATRAAAAAIARDRADALALALQGLAAAYAERDFGSAMLILDRALAAGPNCALAWACAGALSCWTGDGPNAVARAERGLRLSPLDPFVFYYEHILSQAHHTNGTFEEAAAWGRRSAAHNPWHVPTFRTLAASLVACGRREEAFDFAQRVLELEPGFRLSALAARTPLREPGCTTFIRRLREAGLPD